MAKKKKPVAAASHPATQPASKQQE